MESNPSFFFSQGFLWCVALALTIISCGPFRLLFFWRPRAESLVPAQGTIQVVLVHGTFARNARWTRPGHELFNWLERVFGTCTIHRLLWSGDNFHFARMSAVNSLVKWIKNQPRTGLIYLIGHSHGGAIAALAASKVERDDIRVVTLATPFINIVPRNAGLLPRRHEEAAKIDDVYLIFGSLTYLALSLVFFLNLNGVVLLLLINCAFVIGMSTILLDDERVLFSRAHRIVEGIRRAGEAMADESRIALTPGSLLVLRATGDEASSLLAVGQFTCWLLLGVLKIIGTMAYALRILEDASLKLIKYTLRLPFFLFGSLLSFSAISFAVVYGYMPKQYFPIDVIIGVMIAICCFRYRLGTLMFGPPLALVGAIGSFFALLPFGFDLALRSPIASLSVESSPLGNFTVGTIASSGGVLAHSQLYDSPYLLSQLQRFATETAQDKRSKIRSDHRTECG